MGLFKSVFLIKYKIKKFKGFKNLMDSGGPAILGISKEPTIKPGSKGKTEMEPNKEKRYSLHSGR